MEYMIFQLPGGDAKPRKYRLNELPALSGILKKWASVMQEDCKITPIDEIEEFRILKFEGTCTTQKPAGAKTIPTAYLEYRVWQRKDNTFFVVFAPRRYSRAIAILVSAATYGKPNKFSDIEIEKEQYLRLSSYIEQLGGRVNWIVIKSGFGKREDFIGPKAQLILEEIRGGRRAVSIHKMGFKLQGLQWTVSFWGGGQILNPTDPEESHLLDLRYIGDFA